MDTPEVLSVATARAQLSRLLAGLSAEDTSGGTPAPVFIGRYRKPQGVLMSITEYQRLKRAEAVASALGSLRAEGLEPTPESAELMSAYTRGEITADELVARTVARYDATGDHG